MIKTYRILALTICALVGVQAASHAWASAGLGAFVAGGGVVDKSMMENKDGPFPFTEVLGILVHGINGGILIPVLALTLLVVSFLAKAKRSVMWAAVVVGVVALQLTLAYSSHELPLLALFHGLNALVLFTVALTASRIGRIQAERPAEGPSASADVLSKL